MHIAILGASGFVGCSLLRQALARGITVRVLARNPDKLGDLGADVQVVEGDYFDADSLQRLLVGVDAVVSTVGPPENRKSALGPADFGNAMERLLACAQAAGARRVVQVTSAGTSYPGEAVGLGRKLMRVAVSLVAPVVIPAKERELAALMASSIEWVSVRPPLVQAGVDGELVASADALPGLKVDVDQLAGFLLDNLTSDAWLRRAPFVATR